MSAPDDHFPAPAGNHEPTRPSAPADVQTARHAEPGPDNAEYSATVLASHWIQRPCEPDATLVEPPATQPPGATTPAQTQTQTQTQELEQVPAWTPASTRPTGAMTAAPADAPDRADGTVLRFGPGVTAAVARRTDRTLHAPPPAPAPPHRTRRLRRHALPAVVLICVIALLAWQRLGPPLTVGTVRVTARPAALPCDGTADIVGLVTTNGRPGTLSYRWTRSDGTASGVLREVLVRGRKQARLHLLWTFQGRGRYAARAELHLMSPVNRTVVTSVTYDCL